MSERKDGGLAFPNDGKHANGYYEGGMSLRDYFAAVALQGLLATPMSARDFPTGNVESVFAKSAYLYADAMLAARAAQGGKE